MVRAVWNGIVIAESDDTIVLEGNHYFPPDSVVWENLQPSSQTSRCPWKGTAEYYDVVVDESVNRNAVWTYRDPKPAARQIKGYVAFWQGVRIER